MKKTRDIYTTITVIHCWIIIGGLSVSSFGAVFEYSYLAYFWYLALTGIAMMILTSLVLGIMLLLTRLTQPGSSRGEAEGDQGLFSRPKSVRV